MGGESRGSGFSDEDPAAAEQHFRECIKQIGDLSTRETLRSWPGTEADHEARLKLVDRGMDMYAAQNYSADEINDHLKRTAAQISNG